ncbi:protein retinal degeneration B isoform X4 [Venturia canescens]|uniref:protein retinal degeneration B isoform X4 n=1 Tax=Venturia canescens TaxID=32260 RepID=UPI001C9BC2DB|nr:protein retinal degeneration B isoform X4 [Venturia canescens]
MLIKEYRIPLPLTVEEYRIAQLYMIAKKSREESKGAGSGVEIIVNEPYTDGPGGGNGQYTNKIYHVGSHLPGWFKSLLPKSALTVNEEAWNAYPYTKTRYTCPFVEKFSVEIETFYFPDNGHQENVFKLSGSDLRNRIVDVIDVVKDQLSAADYVKEEDPKLFVSEKTGRGPLAESWLEDYWKEVKGKEQPTRSGKSLMCAYKLCRVEFRYWGMQTKLEKFIQDVALRKTMVRAHRQAWAWQDEWNGLTMEDIREIEKQTQLALQQKMGCAEMAEDESSENRDEEKSESNNTVTTPVQGSDHVAKTLAATLGSIEKNEDLQSPQSFRKSSEVPIINTAANSDGDSTAEDSPIETIAPVTQMKDDKTGTSGGKNKEKAWNRNAQSLRSPSSSKSFGIQIANLRMESLMRESESSSDEEFFDCQEDFDDNTSLAKWSSLDLLNEKDDAISPAISTKDNQGDSIFSPSYLQRVASERSSKRLYVKSSASLDISCPASPQYSPTHQPCRTTVLLIAIHAGSVLDANVDVTAIKSDITTFRGAFESVMRQHYPNMVGHIAVKFVSCPSICTEGLGILSSENSQQCKLDFDVSEFFMFGSPLALVLAYRKISLTGEKSNDIPRPLVNQVYNLFHPTDPVAVRLEPLISARFSQLPPVNVARYQKYPLGNGQPYHLLEAIQTNPQIFTDSLNILNTQLSHIRRMSDISLQSTVSGVIDNVPLQAVSVLTQKWWGNKRIDYALYCPEGLANFPTNALPHLFHASYWESSDVIAFILRQLGRFDLPMLGGEEKELTSFRPGQPREKWNKKRTSVKLKNVAANHRANDVIVKEGAPQVLIARFMYSPIDVIALTGEKVDIHIMKDAPLREWTLLSTEVTDKNGRITYRIPDNKALSYGLYPIKMVVRGDHTSVDFFLAVIPPKTECVVFSIDGSFTASMSVTGRDPKVRAGAVDVARHWQELGYLIIYITARPDMQQQKVVSWLSQHNFPHGLVSFADGLSTDPLGHKAAYLINLIQEHGVIIHQAYGSSKDISVYTAINLKPNQIIIVGKVSKKHQSLATILSEGYAAHLSQLQAHGGSRSAKGNARMVIPRGQFGLPGLNVSLRRRSSFKAAKRTTSQTGILAKSESLERSTSVEPSSVPSSVSPTKVETKKSATSEKF